MEEWRKAIRLRCWTNRRQFEQKRVALKTPKTCDGQKEGRIDEKKEQFTTKLDFFPHEGCVGGEDTSDWRWVSLNLKEREREKEKTRKMWNQAWKQVGRQLESRSIGFEWPFGLKKNEQEEEEDVCFNLENDKIMIWLQSSDFACSNWTFLIAHALWFSDAQLAWF